MAPKPAEAPEPDAKVSDTAEAQTKPDEAAKPEEVVEKQDEAAPPEATTEIVTEATETEDKPETSAPATSARPRSKPAKPAAPAPTQTKTAETKPDAPKPAKPSKPAAAASSDAVNDALAEALAEPAPAKTGSGGNGSLASGPPVTAGEKEALIVDVKACWNVGALSSPINLAFGAEFRQETYAVNAGDPASYAVGPGAMAGLFAPAHRLAEFYGLWTFALRLSAIVGPLTYGLVTLLTAGNHRLAIVSTGLFFVVGLGLILMRVGMPWAGALDRSGFHLACADA
mgnify:CR=1 FL=1